MVTCYYLKHIIGGQNVQVNQFIVYLNYKLHYTNEENKNNCDHIIRRCPKMFISLHVHVLCDQLKLS